MMNGLELRSIEKSYGGNRVLGGISLSFRQGKVTAIVGDNGAGKSTLMKSIAGAVELDEGSIALNGVDIQKISAGKRREMGVEMVYQDLALVKQHDVVTNLFLGRELSFLGFLNRREMERLAREKISALGVGIPDLKEAVGNLSGGQQQTIAVARADMFDPRVVIFDEPTAALAVREVEGVLSLIQEQRRKQRIVLLVSHRLNDVFAVADRIIVLKRGAVAFDVEAKKTSIAEIVEKIVT